MRQGGAADGIRRAVLLIGRRALLKCLALSTLRVGVSILDVVGVVLLASFSSSALSSAQLGTDALPKLIAYIVPQDLTIELQLGLAVFFLTTKSALSYVLSVGTTRILNRECAALIRREVHHLSIAEKQDLDQITTQQFHFLLTSSLRASTVGILSPFFTIVAESVTLFSLVCVLLFTSPLATFICVLLLGSTALALYRTLASRQYKAGQHLGTASVNSLRNLQEALHGYRENLSRGTLTARFEEFGAEEIRILQLQNKQYALSNLPRYTLETVVILSLGIVALVTLQVTDATTAVVVLTLFTASTSRMLPSLIPLQAAISEFIINLGFSSHSKEIDQFLKPSTSVRSVTLTSKPVVSIRLTDVSFKYKGQDFPALHEVSLTIDGPGWVSLVGPSGSGKSTLIDVILGVNRPSSGVAVINEVSAREFISENPGYCAYVPQRISVFEGTIAQNIAMTKDNSQIDVERIVDVLRESHLDLWVQEKPGGVTSPVGELGDWISGGQLQRLGIARALYTRPRMLVVDESLSGLDEGTKKDVLASLKRLSQRILVLSVSHDIEVMSEADRIIHLASGVIVKA